jgi:hypothetical protein
MCGWQPALASTGGAPPEMEVLLLLIGAQGLMVPRALAAGEQCAGVRWKPLPATAAAACRERLC